MFRSSSKLPWLSGSTRRHFPIREATKNKQLDFRIPHIPSISESYTRYARYVQVQHGITTKLYDPSIYTFGSEEPDITNMGLMTQHSSHTSNKHKRKLNMSEYRQLQMKRLRSLTIYKTLPRAQDRSWGNKLNVEVHAELLARPKSLFKNIN